MPKSIYRFIKTTKNAVATIYSNYNGTYAFDENFRIIEYISFGKNTLERLQALERNEWLEEEKELIRKHSKDKTYFLGFKNEKLQGVVLSQDINKLEKAADKSMKGLHETSLQMTKLKIKLSVKKDLLIIQASSTIEDLNRTANLLAKRLREWYELYNPEFSKSTEDHEKFIGMITTASRHELLQSIGLNEDKSMGADIGSEDLGKILELAEGIKRIYSLREKENQYLETLMEELCPNVNAVAGSLIGAKLIALAGSFKRLSELPASTIQVLGAEKALFRHIKTGARPPKYGAIFSHQIIQTSNRKLWGKAGRSLADKIAIAAKVDHFKGSFIGDKLLAELERKFK